MTFDQYQNDAMRTSPVDGHSQLLNGVLGLTGEAGEVADIVKKYMFQGHELDVKHIREELGDVLWYIAEAASGIGASLEDIAVENIQKLRGRYPDGFDAERSVYRDT